MFGWTAVDIPLLVLLPVLLVASGFFSGSETALFGLTESQRLRMRRTRSLSGRATESLLADQRMLLITLLLGNMTVNVLYFVASSVLLMRAETTVLGQVLLGVSALIIVVIAGEVVPKLLANSRRMSFIRFTAAPMAALHGLISPLRHLLDKLIVTPLSLLTAPAEAPPRLNHDELAALVGASGRQGVLDQEEQRILQDVLMLGQQRVREVMTPRVRLSALPQTASRREVEELVRSSRRTQLPVYDGDLDSIVGMLPVKSYLLFSESETEPLRRWLAPTRYVPEVATLDQLLTHFRETGTDAAVVIDEYGGTAGIVAIEDIVEELVGEITSSHESSPAKPIRLEGGRFRVEGDMNVRDWAEAFGQKLVSPRVSTLGGLIFSRLGRAPRVNDHVELGNVRITVERVDRSRVLTAIVTLTEEPPEALDA